MSSNKQKLNGSLAAAVALAAGTQAYGVSFVATPVNLASAIGTTTTRAWDVDGNSVNDFVFQFRFPNTTGTTGVVWQANMNPVGPVGNAVVGYLGPFVDYATNLASSQPIGPTLPFGASFRTAAQVTLGSIYRSGGVPNDYGGFRPGTPNPGGASIGSQSGYAGFRIGSGASARYGWIQLLVSSNGIAFVNAAIGDVGEAVQAGPPIPEPTSLAAIALGAMVFLPVRRRTPAQRNARAVRAHIRSFRSQRL